MADLVSTDYAGFLADLKTRIRTAQTKAALSVNRELIALYFDIGRLLVEKQETLKWGDAVISQIARDLKREFPAVEGYSKRNLYRMRAFYLAYKDDREFVPQLVAQIPWGHNILLLEKEKDPQKRLWYAEKTLEKGWSRAVLTYQLETDLHARQTSEHKSHNFDRTLPPAQSDLAAALLKDEYVFDFLSLAEDAKERDLEAALLLKIRDFLLELGQGFAFMGSQHHLEVGGQDFYVDLLFYHHRLRCLVAIDLKIEDFAPSFVGQLGFYLAVLDDKVKHPQDGPTIGLLLCKNRNHIVVEYALSHSKQPMAVADYRFSNALPAPEEWEQLLADETEE
ncbi:MAG TPA: PDDEXK nuclease domain-containing protein [Abditibacterium sp.]|jgi:predicted nuclease of restriction endonuclease-like (RecB) superfamily